MDNFALVPHTYPPYSTCLILVIQDNSNDLKNILKLYGNYNWGNNFRLAFLFCLWAFCVETAVRTSQVLLLQWRLLENCFST